MKKTLLIIVIGSILVLPVFTIGTNAIAQPIRWKMSTTWTPDISLIEADKYFARLVNKLSDGKLEIKFFEGGALVPPFQIFDAVRQGTLDAGGEAGVYWSGKNTAFGLLCQCPLGPSWVDYMIWVYQAGGIDLYKEIYGKFDTVYFPHGVIPTESGLRTNKPVGSIADLKGLKVRMSGEIQGRVLKDIGASQVMLAGGEVYHALEKGVIDGGEFSGPGIDWGMGFQEVTKYWAAPGWHQPGSVLGVMINKNSWNKLSPHLKDVIETAAQATFLWSTTFWEHSNFEGTTKFLDKGIKVTKYSSEDLAKLQKIANKHIEELSKANPDFAKVAYSQFKFLKDAWKWREIQSPFGYGRNAELPNLDLIKSYIK